MSNNTTHIRTWEAISFSLSVAYFILVGVLLLGFQPYGIELTNTYLLALPIAVVGWYFPIWMAAEREGASKFDVWLYFSGGFISGSFENWLWGGDPTKKNVG